MRIRLSGWTDDSKKFIKLEGKGWHKVINVCYIRDTEKIKEMEDNGFAYCNRNKSLLQ